MTGPPVRLDVVGATATAGAGSGAGSYQRSGVGVAGGASQVRIQSGRASGVGEKLSAVAGAAGTAGVGVTGAAGVAARRLGRELVALGRVARVGGSRWMSSVMVVGGPC